MFSSPTFKHIVWRNSSFVTTANNKRRFVYVTIISFFFSLKFSLAPIFSHIGWQHMGCVTTTNNKWRSSFVTIVLFLLPPKFYLAPIFQTHWVTKIGLRHNISSTLHDANWIASLQTIIDDKLYHHPIWQLWVTILFITKAPISFPTKNNLLAPIF